MVNIWSIFDISIMISIVLLYFYSIINSCDMISITKILLAILLLSLCYTQQICLKQECAGELTACDDACVVAMGKCTFDCTLSSLGCMQKCLAGNQAAENLLECSFNKCINLWSLYHSIICALSLVKILTHLIPRKICINQYSLEKRDLIIHRNHILAQN